MPKGDDILRAPSVTEEQASEFSRKLPVTRPPQNLPGLFGGRRPTALRAYWKTDTATYAVKSHSIHVGSLNSLAKLLTISQHQSVNQSSFLKSIMLYKGPAGYKTNLQLVYGVTKEALPFIFADGSQRYSSNVMSPYSDLRCTKYTDHPLLGPCLLASIQSGTPGGAFCAQSWKQGINPLDHIKLACLCATVVTLKYVL